MLLREEALHGYHQPINRFRKKTNVLTEPFPYLSLFLPTYLLNHTESWERRCAGTD